MLHVSIRKFSSFVFLLLLSSWQHRLGYSEIVNLYDDTDPSEDNLKLISDTEHIENVKKGLKAIFDANEVLVEQRFPVIKEHFRSYAEYWLEFYEVRVNYKPSKIEAQPSYYLAWHDFSHERFEPDELLTLCLELKVRALSFTDEIRNALDNPTYQPEPFEVHALEAKLSNPDTARFQFPHLRCNDAQNESILLRLRVYLLRFRIKKNYPNCVINPRKNVLEELENFSIIENVKGGLNKVFQHRGVVEMQRIRTIEKDIKTYVRYWLEYHDWRYSFNVKQYRPVPHVNHDDEANVFLRHRRECLVLKLRALLYTEEVQKALSDSNHMPRSFKNIQMEYNPPSKQYAGGLLILLKDYYTEPITGGPSDSCKYFADPDFDVVPPKPQ